MAVGSKSSALGFEECSTRKAEKANSYIATHSLSALEKKNNKYLQILTEMDGFSSNTGVFSYFLIFLFSYFLIFLFSLSFLYRVGHFLFYLYYFYFYHFSWCVKAFSIYIL